MKKLLLILGVSAALFGGMFINQKTGFCAWCPSYKCFAPCGGGCLCVTVGGEVGGTCVSVNRAEFLKTLGYKELR